MALQSGIVIDNCLHSIKYASHAKNSVILFMHWHVKTMITCQLSHQCRPNSHFLRTPQKKACLILLQKAIKMKNKQLQRLTRASFRGGGRRHSLPLDKLLPPFKLPCHVLMYTNLYHYPPHSHKTLFCPSLSHFTC